MSTIIDELIVRLGLDASDFEKGQKKATQSFLKTKEGALATGKNIEDGAKKVANSIERMTRNVLALFGAIAGARSLSDLVSNLTQGNAELGRFSANVNLGPQTMAAWVAAAERLGGTGAQVKQTFGTLSQTFTNFRNGLGQMPEEFWRLRQASGVNIDPLADTGTAINQISEAIQKLSQTDRQSAFNFASAMGIDSGTFEVMRKYGKGADDHIKSLEKSVAPSNESIKVAQKLQESWAKLVQQILKLIDVLYTKLGPTLDQIIDKMSKWLDENQEGIIKAIADAAERLSKAFEDVSWADIQAGFKSAREGAYKFATAAIAVKDSIGGITVALTALFALWTGAQFAKVLANMRILAGGAAATTATAGTTAAGTGLAALLARLTPWVAMLSLAGDTKENKYQESTADQRQIARDKSRRLSDLYSAHPDIMERANRAAGDPTLRKPVANALNAYAANTGQDALRNLRESLISILKDGAFETNKDGLTTLMEEMQRDWDKAKSSANDDPGGKGDAATLGRENGSAATKDSPTETHMNALNTLMQELRQGWENVTKPVDDLGGKGDNGLRNGGGTTVDGRPVSRANPMPVTMAQGGTEGGGFWSWLGNLFSGNNNGTAPTSPGPVDNAPQDQNTVQDRSTQQDQRPKTWLENVTEGAKKYIRKEYPGLIKDEPTEGGENPENGWWTAERQKHAYKRLREEAGLSHEGAKGLISRWANVEAAQGPGAVNPNSGAFGIAQWLTKDRLDPIRGNTNYDDQLAHAIKELNGAEKKAGDKLRNAKTSEEGAIAASTFERAEGWNGQSDNFVNKTLAGMKGMDEMLSSKLASNLSYTNQNATRNKRLKPELEKMLSDSISKVYGDGYRGEIYSGGQDEIGKGPRRKGSTRHDNGGAGDVYIVGPDGKRLKGDQLAPLAQYWLANKNGGVGLEMENGGIHLDEYKNRAKNWWYKQHTKKQAEAVNAGLMGTMPELMGADLAAKTNAIANNDNRKSTTSSVDTRIGNVHIHTQATDGKSIADDIWDGLHKRVGQSSQAAAANFGPQ